MSWTLPDDWDEVVPADDSRPKPIAAAYVVKIVHAGESNGRLRLELDIDDGDFKGYFAGEVEDRKARGAEKVYWGLTYSIPMDFADTLHGGFYKRLFKRLAITLEACNQNFIIPRNFDERAFVGKRFIALVYIKEKKVDGRTYQNYYVSREYTFKQLAEFKVPESWIEDERGERRKPNETAKAPIDDDELQSVDDVDIPF